jgi:hypothetical protein
MILQRVVGIALGYEDLNDDDELRHDPVLAVLVGKLAAKRVAGKSTLNLLELSQSVVRRYHKVSHDASASERLLVDVFLEAHRRPPAQIIPGFAPETPMVWCEANRVDFLFGLARNERLEAAFMRWTRGSWSEPPCHRKAEVTSEAANPRFVITSLKPREVTPHISTRSAARVARWRTGSKNASLNRPCLPEAI